MRELILQMMVSVDGMTEGPGQNLDWIEVVDPDLDNNLAELLDSVDAQIFGRSSYELLAQYWPDAVDQPLTPGDTMLAPKVNALPKIVVSGGEPDLAWQPATRIGLGYSRDDGQYVSRPPGSAPTSLSRSTR